MDHLDVVSGPIRTHVATARLAVDLGCDLAENGRNYFVRFAGAARHEGGAFEGAFFAAGDATANIMNSLSFEIVEAPLGISEKGVSAIEKNVACFRKPC